MAVSGSASNGVAVLGCGVVPSGIEMVRESMLRHEDMPAFVCSTELCGRLIPAATARRLGRVHKMALAAAKLAIDDSGVRPADPARVAVSVGTGLGSQTETADFLENMIRRDEAEPKPARFVNSVHNSVASQLAICSGFGGENHTFTHQSISFELALWQAVHLLRSGRADYVLACGADELSPYLLSLTLSYRWRHSARQAADAPDEGKRVPGEGYAAFILAKAGPDSRAARIAALRVGPINAGNRPILNPRHEADFIDKTVRTAGLSIGEVDFVLTGISGDAHEDAVYGDVLNAVTAAAGRPVRYGRYKHLCGDYCTASAFGLAAAVRAVREGRVPQELGLPSNASMERPVSNVLLYNVSRMGHSACLVTQ